MSDPYSRPCFPYSRKGLTATLRVIICAVLFVGCFRPVSYAQSPEGTTPLSGDADLASEMVAGIDRFLLKKIGQAAAQRQAFWQYDTSSVEAWQRSIEPNRERLARILGVTDTRVPFAAPEVFATVEDRGLLAATPKYRVFAVRWPVLPDPAPTARELVSIHAEGLLLVPDGEVVANVVAIPHCDHSPEQIAGLAGGIPPASQYARRLAESGCRVIVPTLVSRERSKRNGRADLTNREYLYRSAFELGKHLLGYEIQKVLAAVDWFEEDSRDLDTPIGVLGYGEGGHVALLTAALDTRVDCVGVSGAMGYEHLCWNHPLDRNVFGILKEFGTAELGSMVLPRRLVVDFTEWPTLELEGNGGAPASIRTPPPQPIRDQLDLVARQAAQLKNVDPMVPGIVSVFGDTELFFDSALGDYLNALAGNRADGSRIKASRESERISDENDRSTALKKRERRQFQEIDRHNQALLRESPFVRKAFLKDLKTSSLAEYKESVEAYRETFRKDVIGQFDESLLPFNARSRKTWDTDKWTGHEVVLDVFPDVMAYGVLLLPKDLKPGERRPVVVCQHGLEGRPTDTFLDDHRAYHDFAAKLCERGFITFAPQNPYIFQDRFRTLQRKANPLGKSLFSIIGPQHQQIVNWLKTQSFVDSERIGFYGLSYGGKSAMRIPALVTDYCLSICSADFNEWVLKNASTRHNFSYVWTGEYEIFEWNLGQTFNYFEMAALICPRPFMVERGHFDGVGEDDWVGYEYGKVRHLYAAKLKIPDRTEIEWFDGPHTINGKASFDFLHRHLNWPQPTQ